MILLDSMKFGDEFSFDIRRAFDISIKCLNELARNQSLVESNDEIRLLQSLLQKIEFGELFNQQLRYERFIPDCRTLIRSWKIGMSFWLKLQELTRSANLIDWCNWGDVLIGELSGVSLSFISVIYKCLREWVCECFCFNVYTKNDEIWNLKVGVQAWY